MMREGGYRRSIAMLPKGTLINGRYSARVYFPEWLFEEVKSRAAEAGKSFSSTVVEMLEDSPNKKKVK